MSSPSGAWQSGSASNSRMASSDSSQSANAAQLRRLGVKVLFTLDGDGSSSCLARLEGTHNIPTIPIDATTRIGVIDLKTCLDAVMKGSPELKHKLKQGDFTVYASDFTEDGTPQVGHGRLSELLAGSDSSKRITGRVCSNLIALFGGDSTETLEVKLRFTHCPNNSPKKPKPSMDHFDNLDQLVNSGVDINAWNDFIQDPLSDPLSETFDPMSPIQMSQHTNMQAFDDAGTTAGTPVGTPMTQNDFNVFDDEQFFNAVSNCSSPAPSINSPAPFSQSVNDISRPASRVSLHSNTSAQSPFTTNDLNPFDETVGEDGRARKRARLTQASKPRGSLFAVSTKAPLRQTATTAASVRNFRTGPESIQQQQRQNDVSNRVPTPRPQRYRNLERRQSGLARSALRQESSMSSPTPFETSETLLEPSSDVGMQEQPTDIIRPSSPNVDFPSSPPLLPFNIHEDDPAPSSPLPESVFFNDTENFKDIGQMNMADDSEFSAFPDSNIDSDFFDIQSDGGFSNLPLPMSDSGFFSDGIALQTPVKAIDIGPPSQVQPELTPQNGESERQKQLRKQRLQTFPWKNSTPPQTNSHTNAGQPNKKSLSKARSSASWRHDAIQPPQSDPAHRPEGSKEQGPEAVNVARVSKNVPKLKHPTPKHPSKLNIGQQNAGFALPGSEYPSPAAPLFSPHSNQQGFALPSPVTHTSPDEWMQQAQSHISQRKVLGPVSGNANPRSRSQAGTPQNSVPSPSDSIVEGQTPTKSSTKRKRRQASKTPAVSTPAPMVIAPNVAPNIVPAPSSDPIPSDIITDQDKTSRRQKIAAEREAALQAGTFPRFCEGCGNVDTPTWRRIFAMRRLGAPPFGTEKGTSYYTISTDDDGKVMEHMVYRKTLSQTERAKKDWTEHTLCNSCGIHFANFGKVKIPIVDPSREEVATATIEGNKENAPPSMMSSMPPLQKQMSTESGISDASRESGDLQKEIVVVEIQDEEGEIEVTALQTIETVEVHKVVELQDVEHPLDHEAQRQQEEEGFDFSKFDEEAKFDEELFGPVQDPLELLQQF